jgi:hypothetical protein
VDTQSGEHLAVAEPVVVERRVERLDGERAARRGGAGRRLGQRGRGRGRRGRRARSAGTTTVPARRATRAALQSAAPCEMTGDIPESRSTCDDQASGIETGCSSSRNETTCRAPPPPETKTMPLLGRASSTPPTSIPQPASFATSARPYVSSERTVASPTRSPWCASVMAALTAPPPGSKRYALGSFASEWSPAALCQSASPAQITSNPRARDASASSKCSARRRRSHTARYACERGVCVSGAQGRIATLITPSR